MLSRMEEAERLGGTAWAACASIAGLKPVVRTHESDPNATGHDPADHRSNDRMRPAVRYPVDPFQATCDHHRIGPGPGGEGSVSSDAAHIVLDQCAGLALSRHLYGAHQSRCRQCRVGDQNDIDKAKALKVHGYIVKATTIPSEVVSEVEKIYKQHQG